MSAPSKSNVFAAAYGGCSDEAAEQIFAAFNANRQPDVGAMLQAVEDGTAPIPGQFGGDDADDR